MFKKGEVKYYISYYSLAIVPNSEEGNPLLKWTLIAWDNINNHHHTNAAITKTS